MQVGARIGGYELVEELARGGVGAVFRARAADGRSVAVKLLLHGRGAGPDTRQRFLREARALTRLRHPGVVAVEDAGEVDGNLYLAMELVEGEDLEARLERDGPAQVRVAVGIARRLAEALAHAHAQGVLHRDLKPANVLVRPDGTPVLGDFGLTRDVEPSSLSGSPSLSGVLLGTPGWWPPEQARGELARIGPRSDVYGAGAVLYALLTGGPPHGEPGSLVEALAALERPVEPPSRRRPGIDARLDAICVRALANEPGDRQPDAATLARELAAWEAGTPIPGGRRRGALAAALLGLGAAVGVALLAPWRERPETAAPVVEAAPASAHPRAPLVPAARWRERVQRERDVPVSPRPGPLRGAEISLLVDAATADEGLARDPILLERTLRPWAEEGHAGAQYELGRLLLERPRRPRGGVACEAEAAALLWTAGRSPPAPRALARLAALLLEGAGSLAPESEAAREVLRLAERAEPAEWNDEKHARAACAWLALGGPGDLAVALTHPVTAGGEPDSLRPSPEWSPWREAPAGRVGRAIGLLEGWCKLREGPAAAQDELRGCLLAGDPAERRAARSWLDAAAVAGDPAAAALLTSAGLPRPDPEALDWRDLLALDGLTVVARPNDPLTLVELGEGYARIQDGVRAGADPARQKLRELALRRHPRAELDLAHLLATSGEPREAIGWSILGGLLGVEEVGALNEARVLAAGLIALHAAEESAPAIPWLERTISRMPANAPDANEDLTGHWLWREARLWLAVLGCRRDEAGARELLAQARAGAMGPHEHELERLLKRAVEVPRWREALQRIR